MVQRAASEMAELVHPFIAYGDKKFVLADLLGDSVQRKDLAYK